MKTKFFNKDFTLVIIGQIISLFGNAVLRFALSLHILDVSGSATVFGTIMAFSIIPTIFLSPFGGMIADRVSRRNIMVLLDFLTAFTILVFGFTLSDSNTIVLTAVITVLLSVIQSFYAPAVQSSIPLLQTNDNIVRGNAMVSQVTMLSGLLAPLAGGFLYAMFGAVAIIFVSAACFLFSAILELFIHIPFVSQNKKSKLLRTVKHDFKASILFITKRRPDIFRILVIIAIFNLFILSIFIVGIPYMIRIVLGLGSELYGITIGLAGIAGIAGGITTSLIAGKYKAKYLYILLIIISLLIFPIGLTFVFNNQKLTSYIIITICTMLVQFFAAIFSILGMSLIQKKTPLKLMGKVTSYLTTMAMCTQPIGQALYGLLFDVLSNQLHMILIVTATISVIVGIASKKVFYRLNM